MKGNEEVITLGMAAERLSVPVNTLRNWAEKLEELDVHYLLRNARDERLITESDMKMFEFIKEQKDIHGRRTTTTNLVYLIAQLDKFEKRKNPNPQNKNNEATSDETSLMTINSVEELAENEQFKQLIKVIGTSILKEQQDHFTEEMEERINDMKEDFANKLTEIEEERIRKIDEMITEQRKTRQALHNYMKQPFYKKWFSKPTIED